MRVLLPVFFILAFLLLLPDRAASQHRDDTIEASWDKAAKKLDRQPLHKDMQRQKDQPSPWMATRSPESIPWPTLPSNPTPENYYRVNTALIDSLTNLYCLSNNYLRTLSNRNESAFAAHPGSPRREFNYNDPSPDKRPPQVRESLEALYKELLGLLERCLHGRQ